MSEDPNVSSVLDDLNAPTRPQLVELRARAVLAALADLRPANEPGDPLFDAETLGLAVAVVVLASSNPIEVLSGALTTATGTVVNSLIGQISQSKPKTH